MGDLGVLIDADHRHHSLVFYVRKEQGEVHRPNRSDSLDQWIDREADQLLD